MKASLKKISVPTPLLYSTPPYLCFLHRLSKVSPQSEQKHRKKNLSLPSLLFGPSLWGRAFDELPSGISVLARAGDGHIHTVDILETGR